VKDRHPDGEELERFLGGELTADASRALQRHVLLCPACEDRLVALLPASTPSPSSDTQAEDRSLVRRLLDDYRAEISRRRRALLEQRSAAAALWREIESADPAQRRILVTGEARFQSWGFFELVLERAFRSVHDEPRRAEELLRLALDLADRLDPAEHGPGAVEAAKARAWIHLGNTLRVRDEFRLAEAAFDTAELYLSRSWLDPLDEALLLEFKTPLRRAQRRFDEALELIEGAIAIYREIREPHLLGRAVMIKGVTLQYKGEIEEAAECFRTSLSLLEEPRPLALCHLNLAGCLQDAGHSAEAAALLPQARRLLEPVGTRTDLLRLRWTEAKVAASLGRTAEAEAAFLEARRAFLDGSYVFDAALISLDLAALYLRQGRVKETKSVAAEILPVFRSREVHRDALAAMIVFQRAADLEHLSLGLVEDIAARLRRAQNEPEPRSRAT
jgi:tetratricopeptide (TPR) repeat protein